MARSNLARPLIGTVFFFGVAACMHWSMHSDMGAYFAGFLGCMFAWFALDAIKRNRQ